MLALAAITLDLSDRLQLPSAASEAAPAAGEGSPSPKPHPEPHLQRLLAVARTSMGLTSTGDVGGALHADRSPFMGHLLEGLEAVGALVQEIEVRDWGRRRAAPTASMSVQTSAPMWNVCCGDGKAMLWVGLLATGQHVCMLAAWIVKQAGMAPCCAEARGVAAGGGRRGQSREGGAAVQGGTAPGGVPDAAFAL